MPTGAATCSAGVKPTLTLTSGAARARRRASLDARSATASGLMPKCASTLSPLPGRAERVDRRSRRRPSAPSRTSTPPRPRSSARRPAAPRPGSPALCCLEELPARHRDDARLRRPARRAGRARRARSRPRRRSRRAPRRASRRRRARRRPGAGPRPARARSRSSIGTFWRESTRQTGPCELLEDHAPRPRRLVRVGRADHGQLRDRAHRGEVLDRLVGRAVLADRDRVVGEDPDARRAPSAPRAGSAGACSR